MYNLISFKRHNLCPLLSVRGFGILDVLFGPTEFSFHKSCTVMMGTGAARPLNICGSILGSSGNLSKLAVSAGVTFIVHGRHPSTELGKERERSGYRRVSASSDRGRVQVYGKNTSSNRPTDTPTNSIVVGSKDAFLIIFMKKAIFERR